MDVKFNWHDVDFYLLGRKMDITPVEYVYVAIEFPEPAPPTPLPNNLIVKEESK